jgi:uncharacterized membrane protein
MNYFYRAFPYLIAIIAFAMGVVFFNAIDCVIAWYKGYEPTSFDTASFWFIVCSLSIVYLTAKYSVQPDPYEKAEDENYFKNK